MIGQGSTTASVNGKITNEKGEPLEGATIIFTHEPTGSIYGGFSREDGGYNVQNLSVGGPYQCKVSFIGFADYEVKNLYLRLGENLNLPLQLKEQAITSEGVEIVGEASNFINSSRSGAQTNISAKQINVLPTVARDLSDFTRLTPQAIITPNGGISLAGMNNRYNAIFIDGAVNNDVFGLSETGTNGGQTGTSPISVDAIEEFQVVLAPYDVRLGGFAGGGINAVTRSGTNKMTGSAYYLFKNESLAGKTPLDVADSLSQTVKDSLYGTRKRLDNFNSYTAGFRVGGPIIKNKLFFFLNAEIQRDRTPQPGIDTANYAGNLSFADIQRLQDTLLTKYGYDAGDYLSSTRTFNSDKILVKFDYNMHKNHKLSLRHSYTFGQSVTPSINSNTSINFSNGGILFPSTTNSTALELKSIVNKSMSNNLIVGFTHVLDDRNPMGNPFPRVIIRDGNARINFGSEAFSTANQLKQSILTLTNNFNIFKGNHAITLGTHNEFYSIYNLFIRQNYGQYEYNNLNDFFTGAAPRQYDASYSLLKDDITGDGAQAAAKFAALQLGFYAQDEWTLNKLKLTGGLRIDVPMFLTQPGVDTAFNNTHLATLSDKWKNIEGFGSDLMGATSGKMPTAKVMLSPRLGFNYDVLGDKSLQVRGGVGVFASRLPYVWAGGAYTNNGVTVGGIRITPSSSSPWNTNVPTFTADPLAQPTAASFGVSQAIPSGEVNLFAKNFKFPKVFRTSLGIDKRFKGGWVLTLEGLITKTLNNVSYYNVNFSPYTLATLDGPDNRPVYSSSRLVSAYSGNVYLVGNTNRGYTYNLTAQIQKQFTKNFFASLAYTYGMAKVINEGTSSQNSSQWRFMENTNGLNRIDLSTSDFSLGNRVVGAVSYKLDYLKHAATTFTLFYNGQSGSPFSYVVDGNLSGHDASADVSLIYVPNNASELTFKDNGTYTAAQQAADFEKFIANDKYLNGRRGKYAERNAVRNPFVNILDLRVLQDFYIKTKDETTHNLQISLDVFNFTNMLNKNWGRRYFIANDAYNIVTFTGYKDAANGDYTPIYQYNKPNTANGKVSSIDDSGVNSSRWQAQVGVRYSF